MGIYIFYMHYIVLYYYIVSLFLLFYGIHRNMLLKFELYKLIYRSENILY